MKKHFLTSCKCQIFPPRYNPNIFHGTYLQKVHVSMTLNHRVSKCFESQLCSRVFCRLFCTCNGLWCKIIYCSVIKIWYIILMNERFFTPKIQLSSQGLPICVLHPKLPVTTTVDQLTLGIPVLMVLKFHSHFFLPIFGHNLPGLLTSVTAPWWVSNFASRDFWEIPFCRITGLQISLIMFIPAVPVSVIYRKSMTRKLE